MMRSEAPSSYKRNWLHEEMVTLRGKRKVTNKIAASMTLLLMLARDLVRDGNKGRAVIELIDWAADTVEVPPGGISECRRLTTESLRDAMKLLINTSEFGRPLRDDRYVEMRHELGYRLGEGMFHKDVVPVLMRLLEDKLLEIGASLDDEGDDDPPEIAA